MQYHDPLQPLMFAEILPQTQSSKKKKFGILGEESAPFYFKKYKVLSRDCIQWVALTHRSSL